jgi:hypothetical protein
MDLAEQPSVYRGLSACETVSRETWKICEELLNDIRSGKSNLG